VGAAPTPGIRRALLAAVLAASVVGAAAAPAESATFVYVSPQGSDRNACTSHDPCRTFDRAYRAARPGQTVILKRGVYGGQAIGFSWKRTSSRDVVFRPAPGAPVVVRGSLVIRARHLELRGLRVSSWIVRSPASDVTLRSVTADRFAISGGSRVTVVGGKVGPARDVSNVVTAATATTPQAPHDIVFDGVTVQGFRRSFGSAPVHCLAVRAVNDLVVRRSRLLDCEDSALFFTEGTAAGAPGNVTIENNVLSGGEALRFDGSHSERWAGFVVRNNSSTAAITLAPESEPLYGLDFYSNIAASFTGCDRPGVTADFNVWESGSACGSNDAIAPSGFLEPAAGNFDLAPGSAAIDHSGADVYAATDIVGQGRPIGAKADAGAYETTASGLVAAYSFNELAGSLASDLSGRGNGATVSGASWTSAGRFGGALWFDGSNDWATVADAPSLDLASQLTLEAWVRPLSLGSSWRTVAIKEQPGNLAYALYASTDTRGASGHVYVDTDIDTRAPSRLPLGAWTHLATTYDGATLRLFVDGAEASRRTLTGDIAASAGPLRLGGNAVWNEWFSGTIDEVRVYDRALPPGQIKKDMQKALRGAADAEGPTTPTGLSVAGQTQSSVSVSWSGSSDDVGVVGYGVYRNGTSVGTSAGTSFTFSGLACGTSYTLGVDAFDAAGNRSAKATLTASTSECPPPDTQAPTVPGGLAAANATTASVAVSWSGSSDDVGVVGYGVYRNGTSVGTSAGTSFTFSGLACGVSYTLGVDAFDAAGNRSAKATLTASTSECLSGGADLYLSSGGSDSNLCTQAAPCRSFDRAYRVAQPGYVVEVAGGTYGAQTINGDSTKTATSDVVFRPAAGATVVVSGEVSVYGDHIELRDMTVGGWKTFLGTDDVTFRDIDTRHLFIWSSSNISVIGGSVGVLNQKTSYDSNMTTASGSSTPPTNILIDGVWFHDWIDVDPGQANHIECLQVGSGVNVTIRNSRFERCGTHDIFIRSWGTLNGSYHPLRNWVIENNFFAKTAAGYYAIQFVDDMAPDATSFVVRNNSTLQAFHDGIDRGTISFVGNIVDEMTSWECGQSSAGRWSYNVYESGVKCGSTDLVGPVGYRNRAALDLHILAGSAAIGRGSPTGSAALDIDGQSRPLGGAPDAGADEVP
jgi:chitodextrinase